MIKIVPIKKRFRIMEYQLNGNTFNKWGYIKDMQKYSCGGILGDSFSRNRSCGKKDKDKTSIIIRDAESKIIVNIKNEVKLDLPVSSDETKSYMIEITSGYIFKESFQKIIKISWLTNEEFNKLKVLEY